MNYRANIAVTHSARTYEPDGFDFKNCAACETLCQPFPHRRSVLCSACYYELWIRPVNTMEGR